MDTTRKTFLISFVLIVLTSIVMVYSSSYMYAKEVFKSSTYFINKHLLHILLGSLLIIVVSRTKFSFWYNHAKFLHSILIIAILLTLFREISNPLKGAYRWIYVGGISIQPAEFFKLTIILASISFFEKFSLLNAKEKFRAALFLLLPLAILVKQPDFGSFIICLFVIGHVAFLSSFPRKYFYSLVTLSIAAVTAISVAKPYRIQRILTYLDPWQDPQNSGFQIIQSYLAFAGGALWGKGIGNSHEKLFYLPEAYNDFIFSVMAEELGLIGITIMVFIFFTLIVSGYKLAMDSRKRPHRIFIATVIFSIGFQSFLNMGVVLGLLPTKGLNLPFVSYGGSSLISNFLSIGLLLSAVKEAESS